MNRGDTWTLWQLADSAFPLGGFSHSGGLEAAVQHGLLNPPDGNPPQANPSQANPPDGYPPQDNPPGANPPGANSPGDDLASVFRNLLQRVAFGDLPLINAVMNAADQLSAANDRCDAVLLNPVARRASLAQGRSLVMVAGRVFTDLDGPAVATHAPLHFAPAFGWLASGLGIEPATARRLYLFISLRAAVSAAIRLNRLGPLAGQALIHTLGPDMERLADAASPLGLNEVCQTAPLLDLAQANHDRLYSRLFQS